MTPAFLILAAIAVAGTAAAMALRNPIHCILALTAGLTGIAALYLQLGAQFAGLTQLMVYVGAVAILAVFAIMMTHRPSSTQRETYSLTGPAIAAALFAVLAWAICHTTTSAQPLPPEPSATVQQIGDALMHHFVLPLEIIGLLLTAALIGAVVIAMDPTKDQSKEPQ
ncbi:MAG TPA: NADH-quinone oxidoreductase subunit J [Acidobacteriaceae bacterium]|nr:NADH-quinone oxidoreductase subunit J [Acidobacteriaceae bacterium]